MFTFFHRKPTITVDCFTDNQFAYEYASIKKTSRCLPDWFKKLPSSKRKWKGFHPEENRNMKSCYGFVELFKRGLIIETWCDHIFTIQNRGIKYNISHAGKNNRNPIVHPQKLYEGGFTNYHHLKLQCPWLFREKTGMQFLYTAPTWLLEDYYFYILPGVLEFKVNMTTATNIMFAKPPVGSDYEIFLRAKQPLAHVIPLCEDKNIEIKNHLLSTVEYNRMNDQCSSLALFGGYKSLIDHKQTEEEQLKCPFHD